MKPTLIDTDILSEFLRGNSKVVENADKYLKEFGILNLSIITYYEVLNGLIYKDAKKQLSRFNAFVELNNIITLTIPSTKMAAQIYADLRQRGEVIGHTDSLIAGIALAENLKLATNNTDHFKRIEGLELVNWLK